MKSVRLMICAAFCLVPLPSVAQNFLGPLSSGAFEATMNMGSVAQALNQQDEEPAKAAPPPRAVDLTFVPDPERRKRILAPFIDNARQTDPATAQALETAFARPAFYTDMARELGRFGLRTDNVADAYTVWWIGFWQASRGIADDPSRASALAVKAQVERAMATTPLIGGMDDAGKQELAETLLIQAMLMGAAAGQAKADPAQMKTVSALALQGGRQAGLDFASMTLTDQGFTQ